MKRGLILLILLLNISPTFGEELEGFTYSVKKGDTLWKIGRQLNIEPQYWEFILKVNKIDEKHLVAGKKILIPKDLEKALSFCPVPATVTNFSERTAYVFLSLQYFGAYENGKLLFWGPISSGRKGRKTPSGTFTVLWKSRNYFSKKYKMPMHYAICFSGKGYFLHQQALPGRPASHGCIRLLKEDARKLFEWVKKGDLIIIQE